MAGDENSDDGGYHERKRRRQRTRRAPRQAANAMSGGTAGADTGADPYQQARYDQPWSLRLQVKRQPAPNLRINPCAGDKPDYERGAPPSVCRRTFAHQPSYYSRYAGDPPNNG